MATKIGIESGITSAAPPTASPPHHRSRRRLQLHCRRRVRFSFSLRCSLLLLPLLYFSGLISTVSSLFSFLRTRSHPAAVYRSHQIFRKLWIDIDADNSSTLELSHVWIYKRKRKEQNRCSNMSAGLLIEYTGSDLYIIVEANGGLNQQRSSICNAVAVAGLLNATLVIPHLEFHNVWRDTSGFADIYDEDHFISTLSDYVKVVKELPSELMAIYGYNISNIPSIHVQAWAPSNYYLEEVYPLLLEQRVVRISPFANRLAMKVPPHIQFLRCLANYKALKFSSEISILAKKMVSRMTEKSSGFGGKYVSIHLRFEEDMVAFSCCVYDGGEAEKAEMDAIREKGWGKKFKQRGRVDSPVLNRINGRCPMSPLEVGMMLRGMGFSKNTPIYLASGKIYQTERSLAPLQKMYPLLQTKDTLATIDELTPLQNYSSRLAALDYIVCLFSEVFVTTQGGNFPHFLFGHRRYLHNGHAKTINPDKIKLVSLLQNTSISWDAFKNEMRSMLAESDRKGIIVPRGKSSSRKGSIYSDPLPECSCLWDSLEPNTLNGSYLMVNQ